MADTLPDATDHLPLSILFSRRGWRHRWLPYHHRSSLNLLPSDLAVGDLVWVKTFPYTWCPGRVCRRKQTKSRILVSFFGEGNRPQWFRESRVLGFEEKCGVMVRMNRRKVGVEIGLAMEELGNRTMTAMMCPSWRSVVGGGGSMSRRLASKVRNRFCTKEVAWFVRRLGVCRFEDEEIECDAAKVVNVAAQILSFRRYASVAWVGLAGGGFRAERLLRSVREMAVGLGVFDQSVGGVVLGQVTAFRNFVTRSPGWVFQELTGLGDGLGMDDSEHSSSDLCSEGLQNDGVLLTVSASFVEKDKSLVDIPIDESKILKNYSEISPRMVDQNITNYCSEPLTASSVEGLPEQVPSIKGQTPCNLCNMFFSKEILKRLHIIATDPFYFESKMLESLSGCILKYRKLNFACTGGYRLRRSSGLFDMELEQQFCLFEDVVLNDDVVQITSMDDSVCDNELSSCENLDAVNDDSLDVCVTSTFTGNLFREAESGSSMEDFGKQFLKTTLRTEKANSAKVTVDANNLIDSSINFLPKLMTSTKDQLVVSPWEEHKMSHLEEMLRQLHYIAIDTCFFGKKKQKTTYKTFLKVRELISLNISNHVLTSNTDCYGSDLENDQLAGLPDDNTTTCIDDQLINCRDNDCGAGIDSVVISRFGIDMDRASSSLINETVMPEVKVTKITHVPRNVSSLIHEVRSQLCLLAIDLYHPGLKTINFVRRSILLYRKVAFQNAPDLSSPINSSFEKYKVHTYDQQFQNRVKEPCIDNRPGCAEDPRKGQTSLAHSVLDWNQANNSVRTKSPFPSDFKGYNIDMGASSVIYTETDNLVYKKESCGKPYANIASPLKDYFGNCEGSLDEPVSIGNLKTPFSSSGDTSHEDASFDVDATIQTSFPLSRSSESSHSEGKVYDEPEVSDGKNVNRLNNCNSFLPEKKKRSVTRQSMSNQTVFCGQSKLQKIQHAPSIGRLHASPLVAESSPILVADESKITRNIQQILTIYNSIGSSKSMYMKFPKGFNIPSKEDLEKKFSVFGLLDHSKTRIFFYTGVAQVVFLHPMDAQTAYRYVNRKKSFIHCDMRFWLDHDKNWSERKRSQALSVAKGHTSLNIKSCLKKPNGSREKDQRKKRQVKFVVDSHPGPVTALFEKGNETSCSSIPGVQQMNPDISGPMLQMLLKCDELVKEVKKNLGSEMFYSYLYRQLISYTTPSSLTDVAELDKPLC